MEKITQRLTELFKKNLIALYVQDTLGDPLLILVLKNANFISLEKLRKVLKKKNFVILSEDDLKEGADVFPVEFLRFKTNAELIKGKDILGGLKIQKKYLRPHLEYELRSKRMYLRMEYLKIKKGRSFLPYIMPTFVGFADSLLYLKSVRKLETLTVEEKLELIQKKYDLDLSVLFQLLVCEDRTYSKQLVDSEIPAIIQATDTILYQLTDKINNL